MVTRLQYIALYVQTGSKNYTLRRLVRVPHEQIRVLPIYKTNNQGVMVKISSRPRGRGAINLEDQITERE
jgi:hypothetical protein